MDCQTEHDTENRHFQRGKSIGNKECSTFFLEKNLILLIGICNRACTAVSLNRDKTTLRLFFSKHDRWRTAAQVRRELAECKVSPQKEFFIRTSVVRNPPVSEFLIAKAARSQTQWKERWNETGRSFFFQEKSMVFSPDHIFFLRLWLENSMGE